MAVATNKVKQVKVAEIEEMRGEEHERISVILRAADISLEAVKGHFGDARAEMKELFGATEDNQSEK